jgi:hypothetical protein
LEKLWEVGIYAKLEKYIIGKMWIPPTWSGIFGLWIFENGFHMDLHKVQTIIN